MSRYTQRRQNECIVTPKPRNCPIPCHDTCKTTILGVSWHSIKNYSYLSEGTKLSALARKSSFNNPNARVINTYSLFNNNCVTTSLEGINSSSKVIDTDIIAPRSLARFMRKYSKENSDVIKIDNPQEFIKDLLNTFKNEKKD